MTETTKKILIIIAAFMSALAMCYVIFVVIINILFGSVDNFLEKKRECDIINDNTDKLTDKYHTEFIAVTSNDAVYYYPVNTPEILVSFIDGTDNYEIQLKKYNIEQELRVKLGINNKVVINNSSPAIVDVFYYEDIYEIANVILPIEDNYICYFYRISYEDFNNLTLENKNMIETTLEYDISNLNNVLKINDYRW